MDALQGVKVPLSEKVRMALIENPYGCTEKELKDWLETDTKKVRLALMELKGAGVNIETDWDGGYWIAEEREKLLKVMRARQVDPERRKGKLLSVKRWP